jgi:DNA replication protein DnaC
LEHFSGKDIGLPVHHCPRCRRELLYFMRPHFERTATEDGKATQTVKSEKPTLAVCECVIARRKVAEAERDARERQDWIDRCLRMGNIDPRFADARFEEWKHEPGTEAAYSAAMKCAQEISAGEQDCGLIILGSVGNGKNTLAACICRYVAEHFKTFAYQSVPALLQSLRDCYDEHSEGSESAILHAMTAPDLLVLNDWGAEKWTDWTESKLYYIVDDAYNKKRNIVVTTNAVKMRREATDPAPDTPEGKRLIVLSELMTARIYDRLLQMCSWVTNEGQSWRRKEAGRKVSP